MTGSQTLKNPITNQPSLFVCTDYNSISFFFFQTHSLAMRRNVAGRRKNFDELLADHRAAKESLLKANKAGNLAYSHSNNSQFSGSMENGDVGSPFLNSKNSVTGGVTCKSNVGM